MRWKAGCCALLLVCLMLAAVRGVAATGVTAVTGSIQLVAYEVFVVQVRHFTATLSWMTNGDATSQVFYDTVSHDNIGDYAYYSDERRALVEKHKVTLNKLSPSTTYYYRVRSVADEAEFVSDEYTFTTLPSPKGWRDWLATLFRQYSFPFSLSWLWQQPASQRFFSNLVGSPSYSSNDVPLPRFLYGGGSIGFAPQNRSATSIIWTLG